MKTIFFSFLLLGVMLVSAAEITPVWAMDYKVIQVTTNEVDDKLPQINSTGQMVWERRDGTHNVIMHYDGKTVKQISVNDYYSFSPRINDAGIAVWKGKEYLDERVGEYAIYRCDGIQTTKIYSITDASIYRLQLNQAGAIFWEEEVGDTVRLMLLDGVSPEVRVIDSHSSYEMMFYSFQLGANGQIVWQELDENTSTLYVDNGLNTMTIASYDNDLLLDLAPQITAGGHVIWRGLDGTGPEILEYDGLSIVPIPLPPGFPEAGTCSCPHTSGGEQAAWEGTDGSSYYLLEFDGISSTRLISTSGGPITYTDINATGLVAWQEWNGNGTAFALKFFDGTEIHQFGDIQLNSCNPQVSTDTGSGTMVAWHEWDGSDFEIFIARPLTPAEMVQQLQQEVDALDLAKGIEQSLMAKLNAALKAISAGSNAAAANALQDFINQVSAQSGKKIPSADAAQLIEAAGKIIPLLQAKSA